MQDFCKAVISARFVVSGRGYGSTISPHHALHFANTPFPYSPCFQKGCYIDCLLVTHRVCLHTWLILPNTSLFLKCMFFPCFCC